jgi:hypothetical protein
MSAEVFNLTHKRPGDGPIKTDNTVEVIRLFAYAAAFGKSLDEVASLLIEEGISNPNFQEPYTVSQLRTLKNTNSGLYQRHFNQAYHHKLTEAVPIGERVLEEAMMTAHDPDTRVRASAAYLSHLRDMRRHLMPELMSDADMESLQPNQRLSRAETEARIRSILEAAQERKQKAVTG